jgi:hypothetical protein
MIGVGRSHHVYAMSLSVVERVDSLWRCIKKAASRPL